jgi:hypothetical protein
MSTPAAERTHTAIPNTVPPSPRTDGDDMETESTREGSVVTDDSVRYQHATSFARPDSLLGRINSHSE